MSVVDGTGPANNQTIVKWSIYAVSIAGLFLPFLLAPARPGPLSDVLVALILLWPLAVGGLWLYYFEAFAINLNGEGVTARAAVAHGANFLMFLPVVGLFMPVWGMALVDLTPALLCAGGGAAIRLLIFLRLPRRAGAAWAGPISLLLLLGCLGAVYGYGAAQLADTRFDRTGGQTFQAGVTARYVSYGRHGRENYRLRLAAWGPAAAGAEAEVPRATYLALNVGDTACVTLHQGALHMGWYRVGLCTAA